VSTQSDQKTADLSKYVNAILVRRIRRGSFKIHCDAEVQDWSRVRRGLVEIEDAGRLHGWGKWSRVVVARSVHIDVTLWYFLTMEEGMGLGTQAEYWIYSRGWDDGLTLRRESEDGGVVTLPGELEESGHPLRTVSVKMPGGLYADWRTVSTDGHRLATFGDGSGLLIYAGGTGWELVGPDGVGEGGLIVLEGTPQNENGGES